jgi:UDP-N-acetylglucosamine--N-acetylmuramyl-(pentapeptide) pyrophosphoryl-undecaprenol N-acetylglucosamine transferase
VRLVLTGGGTGGHVYPAIAIAQAFAAEASFVPLEVTFVGTRGGLEASIVPKAALPIAFVHAAPLTRALSLSLVRTVVDNVRGFFESLAVLHRAQPDVLIATGGYVAFPVVAALRAVRLIGRSHARIALLEPNAVAGLTNRILAPLVDELWYAIAPAHGASDAFVTGTPVRASMRVPVAQADARARLGVPPDATVVVAMGGRDRTRLSRRSARRLRRSRSRRRPCRRVDPRRAGRNANARAARALPVRNGGSPALQRRSVRGGGRRDRARRPEFERDDLARSVAGRTRARASADVT